MNIRLRASLLTLPWLLLNACGDDDSSSSGSASASDSTTGGATSATDGATSDATRTTGMSASADGTDTGADTTVDTTVDTTAASDTESSTGSATDTGDSTTNAGTTTGDDTTGDTTGETGGLGWCEGRGGEQLIDFSYIWIANSPQGTVSKIDTQTATEVGRYYTGPVGSRDPSRTSVSSDGQYAVVANRDGGLTMIAAEDENCVDTNQNGVIDTSTGANDILPWGTDECVRWNIALPATGSSGPRPVSWTIGPQDPITCQHTAGDIWIGWYNSGTNQGQFRLVEGMTGATLDNVTVPSWSGMSWGPYGGAIDSENNFWAIGWGQSGPVVKIDGVTHEATHFGNPGGWIYGMGLDLQGNTYASGCGNGNVYRFDAVAETWSTVATVPGVSCLRGLQVDRNGVAWIAKNGPCGLAAIDTSVEPPAPIDMNIALPGCGTPVGVSIDAEGYVWVVDQSANSAFKVDPDTYAIVSTVTGLVNPYTYSDMTGAGIAGQIIPQ
jgi:hypothetical protein